MTAARLSPAASLLRNSRLFAVPAAISLPPVEPSSDTISISDTATTPYPTRAAIETPLASLNVGDWGLKRPLPTKTTTKSGTPLLRFQRGIDTAEHVVDFESAADHVLTLRKYQELNLRVTLPTPKARRAMQETRVSPFEKELDHTAEHPVSALPVGASKSWIDLSPAERRQHLPKHLRVALNKHEKEKAKSEQDRQQLEPSATEPTPVAEAEALPEQIRRWRYSGPFLAGLNGMEFDAFLDTVTKEKRDAFRDVVKQDLIEYRTQQQQVNAIGQDRIDAASHAVAEVTDDDVADHMRYLRSEPRRFAPLIVKFFDLADGPKAVVDVQDPWDYGRSTISAEVYRESGPPRTHPSAGLSYMKTDTMIENDPLTGARGARGAVAARLLRSRQVDSTRHIPSVGVAGFVVPKPEASTSMMEQNLKWQAVKDGQKLVVSTQAATVSQAGRVEIQTRLMDGWKVQNDVPIDPTERRNAGSDTESNSRPRGTRSSQLPSLDRVPRTSTRPALQPNKDISEELDFLSALSSRTKAANR
jgi:hypothetical protein